MLGLLNHPNRYWRFYEIGATIAPSDSDTQRDFGSAGWDIVIVMFIFLSKILPLFTYPLGLCCLLLGLALGLKRTTHWRTRFIACALALLWVSGTRPVALTVARSLEWRVLPPVDRPIVPQGEVIVVLGGGTRTRTYPRPISEVNDAGDRLLYAAWLYKQGAAPRILVSGGTVPLLGPSKIAEAESMTELLNLMGVPAEAIIMEEKSRNTYENVVESKKILEAEGLTDIILVTSAMHMPRAQAIFAKQGLSVTPAPTDFSVTKEDWAFLAEPDVGSQLLNLLPQADNLALLTKAMKEYVGMAVYWLRGWL